MRSYVRQYFSVDRDDVEFLERVTNVGCDVILVQGFLVDVVSHIPIDDFVGTFTAVRRWEVVLVPE